MSEAAASEPHPEAGEGRGLRLPARLLSEERLARRACRGDHGALEEVYRRYHQELYRFCLAMTGGRPQDAQDALQNAMVKVLRALPGERRPIQLRPWLYRIARNEAVETIRRRREGSELEPDSAGATPPLAETAEARQRLRALIADLAELPERQRAALTLRELSGLGFEQIGASFETSAAVARQTVYEARQSLRQMEAGREMSCDTVRREISDADGRVARRREIRAHLRDCGDCRAFREAIAERRQDLGAIAPLPVALSAGLLQGALSATGASAGTAGAGAAGAGGVGGAVSAAAGSTLAKSVATVAVAGALGVTAADRDLVDAPVLGGGSEPASSPARGSGGNSSADGAPAGLTGAVGNRPAGSGRASAGKAGERSGRSAGSRRGEGGGAASGGRGSARQGGGAPDAARAGHAGGGRPGGDARGRPPAAAKGHGTAGPRKPPQANRSPGPGVQGGGGSNPQPARPAPPPRSDPGPPATAPPPPVPAPAPAPAEEPPAPDKPEPGPVPQAAPSGPDTSVQPSP